MDPTFGPTLSAVVYINNIDSSLTGGYELISDHLQIENLKLCSTSTIFESRLKSHTTNNFDKHSMISGGNIRLQLNITSARTSQIYGVENMCIVRLMDTSLKNFANFRETLIDLNKFTNELQNNRPSYYNDRTIYNTKTAFDAIGLEFIEFRQPSIRIERRDCSGVHFPPITSETDVGNWVDMNSSKIFENPVL
ncbi:unnamed protein product [Dibothriocephalus latus]|uniref:Uncharacterized protein n=1 Tax=Dibothriocephalus latus TaxID=60516 RepID=A0A3P7MCI9_DIBLA|nr:unnamed protein product [Dibothriocephalus latus]